MVKKHRAGILVAAVGCFVVASILTAAADKSTPQERREAASKAATAGNYKDAYEALRKLALDEKCDPLKVGDDLNLAIDCLRNLGRVDEVDEFREAVIKVHGNNWRLLQTAAMSFTRHGEHFGYIVAGKFYRGHKHGGKGRIVDSMQRDRVRALQLMNQALGFQKEETDKTALAQFYLNFAHLLLNGGGVHEPWRLQYLTNLAELPDYEEGYRYWYRYNQDTRGAPVDENGKPIFHHVPKEGYEKAGTDGERWRWMLAQAAEMAPGRQSEVDMIFANFLSSQFGPQTMASAGFRFRGGDDDSQKNESGTYALHTLKETETIAKLATGIKRFDLPDEFNYLKVWERVAGRGKSGHGESARDALAGEFANRRQYVRAENAWKKAIEEYGVGHHQHRQNALNQIVDNWGRFEPNSMQPAGTKATVDFRFRNGNKVNFEAHAIKVDRLLDDVKGYLKSNPALRDDWWWRVQISNIGYRLVERNEQQYIGEKVASWNLDLKPKPEHVDSRVTVETPMLKPGAYLLKAQMANGNLSRIIVWLSDTVIVKKQLDGKTWYFVADAVTGQPIEKANMEFFGWKQTHLGGNAWRIDTTGFAEFSDKDGQLTLDDKQANQQYQWMIIARRGKEKQETSDRFAYLGWSYLWGGRQYDSEYNATRTFVMTDRPVYRPNQKVEFKAWVRHSKYDQPDVSDFAGKPFIVRIHDPKGNKVFEKNFTADEFAGFNGEFEVNKDMTLGAYGIAILEPGAPERHVGNSSFRLEEYKKPEFEVKVEAPKEPVQLGETVTATIEARYYFGAPVTNGKMKIKVLRNSYSQQWYPRGLWDWFYGAGYWWFAGDYPWYPGWREWCGCKRPYPIWWHHRPEQPEVISEIEMPLGPDGTVKIPIDTAPAKALHGDQDHQYAITAEVTDESRRTIVGTGNVLVSRKPFKVFSWLNRGHYRAGDTIRAQFSAQTLDQKPVQGTGVLKLFAISYNDKNEPVEKEVGTWNVDTNEEGQAHQQLKAAKAGQYRLSYKVTDAKKHTIEGGYLFVVRGEGFTGKDYRFNELELVTDRREYAPGDKVKLLINTNQDNGVVLLFPRPANGVYLAPKMIRLTGKSVEEEIEVVKRDMPNMFVEAVTVHSGRVHTETREVIVPPEKRVLNVELEPSKKEYKPGERASLKVKVTDFFGKPFVGSVVLSIYDRSVEYISGGSNVPEIRPFFWKWRRQHHPSTESSLFHHFGNELRQKETPMSNLGLFGETVVEELRERDAAKRKDGKGDDKNEKAGDGAPGKAFGPGGAKQAEGKEGGQNRQLADREQQAGQKDEPKGQEPVVRKNFADTAYWNATLKTDQGGMAEVSLAMPENLTGWKVKAWAMGHGTKVGEGLVEVTTKKDLLVRLQAPRFFVQKDEVVLSANVHNYLKNKKKVDVTLEVEGKTLELMSSAKQSIEVPTRGDKRVDWRVKVTSEGQAIVRMKAVSDEDSDAMQMSFPCFVHGVLKMDSYSGVIRPEKNSATVTMTVPKERRINESRLEVRYSPTLAGALVDALPYLVDYPYGCTEQTLNRFLPTVIVQRILIDMKLDLKDIQKKRTNLNAQEIGDPQKRAEQWKRYPRNPVFDEAEVRAISKAGLQALQNQQCSDGGWGWFSGFGERSYPHTTAVVVHGLQLAQRNGAALIPNVLERGVEWLINYQNEQVRKIQNAPSKTDPWKEHADNLDALVYMVLVDAGVANKDMQEFLYRDRTKLAVYAKAMYGLALKKENQAEKLAMILKNIEQFVVHDDENQTAYLKLPENNFWWYWYGSEIESNSYYLKLLAQTDPKGKTAPGLVKYLLNNRKHATYWNSTRDTAIAIEAMAEYMRASGEDKPDLTIEVWLDGKKQKEVAVDQKNLFSFDNVFALNGDAVEDGVRKLEIRKKGTGPVYFNAYLTNFTLEDHITKAGLEVKVNRKYYKLTKLDKTIKVPGSRGQAADQKVEKYKRTELENLAQLRSGDLVEVELVIDSKNDYEYLCFEDPKAAGFEPVLLKSGYGNNEMGAYMEMRDDRVCFFVRQLPRGKHSVSYRLRAEIPGKFSALPTRGYAMYAPELKGNSDEIKLKIED
jgi:uncharacterized protein YfaS (alpha-2-macroglobulin family)